MTVEIDGVSADATALPDAAPAAAPAAPDPAPQSELTTRDIIRAAVDKQKAGEARADEPAPRSDGRGADGRFAPAATHGADGKPLATLRRWRRRKCSSNANAPRRLALVTRTRVPSHSEMRRACLPNCLDGDTDHRRRKLCGVTGDVIVN